MLANKEYFMYGINGDCTANHKYFRYRKGDDISMEMLLADAIELKNWGATKVIFVRNDADLRDLYKAALGRYSLVEDRFVFIDYITRLGMEVR